MPHVPSLVKKLVVSMVAVGSLSLAGAGVAGAGSSTYATRSFAQAERHFSCTNAERRVSYVVRTQAAFSTRIAKFEASEAKAQQAQNTYLTGYWQRRVAKAQKREAFLLNPHRTGLRARVAKLAEAKCHVTVPTAPTPTTGA